MNSRPSEFPSKESSMGSTGYFPSADTPGDGADAPLPLVAGQPVRRVNLERRRLVFGRALDADVQLLHPGVSRQHAAIEPSADHGYLVRDLGGRAGSLVNGRHFDWHELVFGDWLQLGPFVFRFDGTALGLAAGAAGGTVRAEAVTRCFGTKTTLDAVSLEIEPGQFVGILGASGAGKSTLLDVLSGMRMPTHGRVFIDGADIYRQRRGPANGYVPQDDIVHLELTVEQALDFAAALRLPASVGRAARARLVAQTLRQLGLEERAALAVGRLSGGQRKRVSIGAELLARPPVLFLDEPSSGLDPATEFKLMELLRELANTGCTVVCTTHVMENVFLMDQLAVVAAGRLVYLGPPKEALRHFGIPRFSVLYDRVGERPAEEWQRAFEFSGRALASSASGRRAAAGQPAPETPRARRPPFLRVLLQRQWTLLVAEKKNPLMLLGQPVLIGLLTAWMSDTVGLKLFLAYLATFWFGCSNAAQEIVKELPIYRRERLIGMPRDGYLFMKFGFLGVATSLQTLIFYACCHLGEHALEGSSGWQVASLLATALAAVGIGLAISAWVRTTTQAVMLVPLILLPQIVFSGFVLPSLVSGGGAKKAVSQTMPSYSAQQLMDVSLLWEQALDAAFVRTHALACQRLDPRQELPAGSVYRRTDAGEAALEKLLGWCAAAYAVAWLGLRTREKNL